MAAGSGLSGLVYGARRWASPLERRFLVALGLLVVSVVPLVVVRSVPAMVPVALLAGLAVSPTLIVGMALAARLVPPPARTEGFTWLNSGIGVGAALGSAAAGALADAAGAGTAFLLCPAGALAALRSPSPAGAACCRVSRSPYPRCAQRPDGGRAVDEQAGRVPVTYATCRTWWARSSTGRTAVLAPGDELSPAGGRTSRRGGCRTTSTSPPLVETAVWGAELSTALAGSADRGQGLRRGAARRRSRTTPTSPTRGSPATRPGPTAPAPRSGSSRRCRTGRGTRPRSSQGMLDSLARLRAQGLDVIED